MVSSQVVDEGEVVVVGAGPAGTSAAITLARLGHEVIIVDQSEFPRDKPCGDGLVSSAVKSLMELGLEDVVRDALPIEGARATYSPGRRPIERRASTSSRHPQAHCFPRLKLDQALLAEAINCGVRFVVGRVHQTVEQDGQIIGLLLRGEDGICSELRAHAIVAADGATSRLRRLSGFAHTDPQTRAYAVRQYFVSEKPIEPFFDVRIPLRVGDTYLPGYSWLFPIAENMANIGVGFFRVPRVTRGERFSMRSVLEHAVNDLRVREASRLGDLESTSEPLGAPMAIGFSPATAQDRNILFVGDAANMTDPHSAEGIAAALKSGQAAGQELNQSLTRGVRPGFGERLMLGFPRLGQDSGVVNRAVEQLVGEAWPEASDKGGTPTTHALLEDVANGFMTGLDSDPTFAATPVYLYADNQNAAARELLTEFNRNALETLRTNFPFALDLMHRRLRAGAGPTIAATLLWSGLACGGAPGEISQNGALAGEFLNLSALFLSDATDQTPVNDMSLGNGLSTLTADFALSKGLLAAARLGPQETVRLSRMSLTFYEGATTEADELWVLDRSVGGYMASADDRSGSIHAHAAALGARLAENGGAVDGLSAFGRNLGIAFQISNDVVELLQGDEPTAREAGGSLRRGSISLPVIYALEEDAALRDVLESESHDDVRDEVLRRIEKSHAIERCLVACQKYSDDAQKALLELDLSDQYLLSKLADLAPSRLRAIGQIPT